MADSKPIEMLKSDHRKVEGLFNDFDLTEDLEEKQSIAKEACENLKIHAQVEEENFYPELEKFSEEGKSMIADSKREHQEIKDHISEIEKADPQSEEFEEHFRQMEETTKHHVQEEESKVFPFAEENMKDQMGAEMSAKMMATKGKAMAGQKLEEL